jgi:hypothetical protein
VRRDECLSDIEMHKDMKKKVTLFTLCCMVFALCVSTEAQQPAKVAKIGWLILRPTGGGATDMTRQALRDLGYAEGKNISFESRHADNKLDRLPALADEQTCLQKRSESSWSRSGRAN